MDGIKFLLFLAFIVLLVMLSALITKWIVTSDLPMWMKIWLLMK